MTHGPCVARDFVCLTKQELTQKPWNMLAFLPLRFVLLLLFNEAEVSSPSHVSSGFPLSSKGITKLIIEVKMGRILVVYTSSFTRVGDTQQARKGVASIIAALYFIS